MVSLRNTRTNRAPGVDAELLSCPICFSHWCLGQFEADEAQRPAASKSESAAERAKVEIRSGW